jgi:hypothetical protein
MIVNTTSLGTSQLGIGAFVAQGFGMNSSSAIVTIDQISTLASGNVSVALDSC